jgi:hypothetical protein
MLLSIPHMFTLDIIGGFERIWLRKSCVAFGNSAVCQRAGE